MTLWDAVTFAIIIPCLLYTFAPNSWRFWLSRPKREGKVPFVVPESGYDDKGNHGLILENAGESDAFHVELEPLRFGKLDAEFGGPEVRRLRPGETCFFHVEGHSPAFALINTPHGAPLWRRLRSWQRSIGERWEKEAEGRIRYKDSGGGKHKTRYRVGADVLNRKDGLVAGPVP